MPHHSNERKGPFFHGRFKEDQMGKDRWAIEFYSFTGAMKMLIVDHLPSRDEAIALRNELNDSTGITAFIEKRKKQQQP